MKIRINTIMAHPVFGCAEPGTILDLHDADAKVLIEAGAAEAIGPRPAPAARAPESAMLYPGAHGETAMTPAPHGRSPR